MFPYYRLCVYGRLKYIPGKNFHCAPCQNYSLKKKFSGCFLYQRVIVEMKKKFRGGVRYSVDTVFRAQLIFKSFLC